jgi:hypothetical protein
MSNIRTISGVPFSDGRTPQPSVVQTLEELLEKAKAGEIDGVFAAVRFFDGGTSRRLAGVSSPAIIGEVALLQYRLTADFDEQ